MKASLLLSLFVSLLSLSVQAKSKDICEEAAWKVVSPYFEKYTNQTKAEFDQANSELGEDEEPIWTEDDLPGGLDLVQQLDDVYSFGWGERQECACGVDVTTQKSADGKSCSAKVNKKTHSCECG